MANKVSKNLRLTSLSAADDGLYKCRATNRYGKAVSSEATLTVIGGKKKEGFSLIISSVQENISRDPPFSFRGAFLSFFLSFFFFNCFQVLNFNNYN